jgi:hypothetical protein
MGHDGTATGGGAQTALSEVGGARFPAEWLELRESADAAARARELIDPLRTHLARRAPDRLVVRDLGCGTGSMGRWLAGQLPGPQHWILHDRDPDLLERAVASLPTAAADGAPVTAEAAQRDVTELGAVDLAGTTLVTASALLDLLTEAEVAGLALASVAAGCASLQVLSVAGRVELTPPDPLDAEVTEAFNAHQRRSVDGRRLLGPDALDVAAAAFERAGAEVHRAASPWRLGADQSALTEEWLRGWVAAARVQEPALGSKMDDYLRRRLAECARGELWVTVQHGDLLALPTTQ